MQHPTKEIKHTWNANENQRLWEQIISVSSGIMACLLLFFNAWYYGNNRESEPWIMLLWAGVLFFSIARFHNIWPYSASSFVYFRNTKVLYRTAITNYSLRQGTIDYGEIKSVHVENKRLHVRCTNERHTLLASHFPKELWQVFLHDFLERLEQHPKIKITRLVSNDEV